MTTLQIGLQAGSSKPALVTLEPGLTLLLGDAASGKTHAAKLMLAAPELTKQPCYLLDSAQAWEDQGTLSTDGTPVFQDPRQLTDPNDETKFTMLRPTDPLDVPDIRTNLLRHLDRLAALAPRPRTLCIDDTGRPQEQHGPPVPLLPGMLRPHPQSQLQIIAICRDIEQLSPHAPVLTEALANAQVLLFRTKNKERRALLAEVFNLTAGQEQMLRLMDKGNCLLIPRGNAPHQLLQIQSGTRPKR